MALPQQVIERLSREPPKTPGWSFGLLMFSGVIFFIALLAYFGLTLGYEPYLNGQISQLNAKIDALAKSISPDDQARFITFYSEITNLKSVLGNHVFFSQFLAWLEKNTQANVYYSHLAFSSENRIMLTGNAKSVTDISQQIAIFEAAHEVNSVGLSAVSFLPASGQWQFNVTLTMGTLSNSTP